MENEMKSHEKVEQAFQRIRATVVSQKHFIFK